ncbi:MAG TPA: hypothetical protein VN681_08090 [Stellaceae bacterium]|nr:hypothetical protein [Stellaceae bacterium]
MRKTVAAMVALLAFGSLTAPAIGGSTTVGFGGDSCSQWTQNHSKGGDKVAAVVEAAWVDGFVSGLNLGLKVDILRGADGDGLIAWTNSYCATHPLSRLADAGTQLAHELLLRASQ